MAQEIDFGFRKEPISPPPITNFGKNYPTLTTQRTDPRTPWLIIFLVALLGIGVLFYCAYQGYFKSDVDQNVEVEPNFTSNSEVNNDYQFNPETKNEYNNTILNDLTIKVYIDGDEVITDVE